MTLLSFKASAQCTWDSVYYNSWETTVADTNVITGTVYTSVPQTYAHHSGAKSLYMNIQNSMPAGTLFYDQKFSVCPGATYKFSGWFTTTFSGTQCNINIIITDSLGNTIDSLYNQSIPYYTSWVNLKDSFVAVSNQIHFKLVTNVAGGNGNDLSMDDFSLLVCQSAGSVAYDTVQICGSSNAINLFDSIRPVLASGGVWSGPTALTGGSLGTFSPATNTTGTYTYSLVNANGCPGGQANVMVYNNLPSAAIPHFDTIQLCLANSVTLSSPSPSMSNLWSTGSTASSISVSTVGTYWLRVTNHGCVASDTAHVALDSCQICPYVTIAPDTTVCPNTPAHLYCSVSSTGTLVSTVWSPSYGLSSIIVPNPTATVSVDTMYRLAVTTRSNNSLVQNGDFSQGNTSFTSGYTYTTVPPVGQPCNTWGILGCDGYYTINTNANNTHSNFASFPDHTTGTGNMLIANGSQNPSLNVWCQTINVLPNTRYDFSAWVTSCVSGGSTSLPHLKFTINGVAISPAYTPSTIAGVWGQFAALWTSGPSTTTVDICINDSSNVVGGNDFAIDDIAFNAVCTAYDSVRVHVYKNPVFTLPATMDLCGNGTVILNPTFIDSSGILNFNWPADGSTNRIDTFSQSGTYTLYVSNQCANSISSASTVVNINYPPKPYLGVDTALCNQPFFVITHTDTNSTPLATPASSVWSDGSTASTDTVRVTGQYWVRDSNGCGVTSDTINVALSIPPVQLWIGTLDTTICFGSPLTLGLLSAPLGDTLIWQDGTRGPVYNVTTSGHYALIDSNACGSAIDTANVNIFPLPVKSYLAVGKDTALCSNGQTLVLGPTPLPTADYSLLWMGTTDTLTTDTVSARGLVILRIKNYCYTVYDSVNVIALLPPAAFTLGNLQTLCAGKTLTLMPVPLPPASDSITYLWQDGVTTTDSFVVSVAGQYSVVETNQCGTATNQITITSSPLPTVSLDSVPMLCDSSSVTLDTIETDVLSYRWNNGATDTSISINRSGTYTVTVSNNCGTASSSVSVKIMTSPVKPFHNMAIDTCSGSMVMLDAQNAGRQYLWSGGQTTEAITVDAGTYYVTISDSGQCPIKDTVYVLYRDCPHCRVLAPSAFSPNGDGKNDLFKPAFECGVDFYTLKVYNRWGEMIFESNDPTQGWDGLFRALPQPVGVYQYYVHYKDSGDTLEKTYTGNVTLLR